MSTEVPVPASRRWTSVGADARPAGRSSADGNYSRGVGNPSIAGGRATKIGHDRVVGTIPRCDDHLRAGWDGWGFSGDAKRPPNRVGAHPAGACQPPEIVVSSIGFAGRQAPVVRSRVASLRSSGRLAFLRKLGPGRGSAVRSPATACSCTQASRGRFGRWPARTCTRRCPGCVALIVQVPRATSLMVWP